MHNKGKERRENLIGGVERRSGLTSFSAMPN
jgi:hypothetical protein